MAKMRRVDSKAALRQQQSDLRRGARGKAFIGQDTGAAAGRAAELARVHRMQEALHQAEEAQRVERPVVALVADLLVDAARLASTVIAFPFRVAAVLRGSRSSESHA